MGYAVLHMEKTSGTDAAMSAHIERTIRPKNADAGRTHLNRELISFPDGIENRTQAIQHRLDTAGLTRKIGNNQVRAIRILLTGTHEDMERITNDGIPLHPIPSRLILHLRPIPSRAPFRPSPCSFPQRAAQPVPPRSLPFRHSPGSATEIIHRKSRKMRRFFCFFISSPYICPTNKIILFNTYPFITDRTN